MIDVGSQVVCIRDDWNPAPEGPAPVKGCVYTVRDIFAGPLIVNPLITATLIRLYELVGQQVKISSGPTEVGFLIDCFREVKKTDISIFKEILVKSPNERVPA